MSWHYLPSLEGKNRIQASFLAGFSVLMVIPPSDGHDRVRHAPASVRLYSTQIGGRSMGISCGRADAIMWSDRGSSVHHGH